MSVGIDGEGDSEGGAVFDVLYGEAVSEQNRTEQGHTFLSVSEKEKLIRDAASRGMTQSAYIRSLILSA